MMTNQGQKKSEPEGKLQHVNLKNVRFHSSDKEATKVDDYENLQKLDFVHCEFNDGHKLYEDTNSHIFPEEQRAGILKRLEYNYRYLRKHFDEKGDYIEGNDFHYNYMEAKRKNTKNAWDGFLLGLYGIINGYNTKPERTLYWLFGMFLLFTLLIASVGNFSIKHAVEKDTYVQLTGFPNYCTKLGYSLSYNATNLMPILKSDRFIGIDGWSIGIGIFENISGVVLIALLVMALRNRFRRSKSEDEFK